jgi:hypothetical protein
MKPRQRFAQLVSALVLGLLAMTACRKGVPPPPTPDEVPRPKTIAVIALDAAAPLRLGAGGQSIL